MIRTAFVLDFLSPTTAGLLMFLGAVPTIAIIYWLRNDWQKPAVLWFQLAMATGMLWSILFGLLAVVVSPDIRFVVTNFLLIAIPSSAIFYFLFCYEFTFKKKPPTAALLLFVPVVLMFVLAWFNPNDLIYTTDHQFTSGISINEGIIQPVINIGMGYLLVILSAGMVLGELLSSPQRERKIQAFVILISIVVVSVLSVIKILGLPPAYFDPVPIGWTVSGLLFAVSIKRYQFLQLSSVPWEQIADSTQDVVIVFDSENIVLGANNTARELLSITLGMTLGDLRKQNPQLTAAIDEETTTTVEIPVANETYFFDVQSLAFEYGRGADGRFVVLRDITRRNAAQQELEATKEYYQRILEQSLDYALVIDESDTITDLTPGVEAMSGFSPDEVIGQNAFEAVHPDDRDRVRDSFDAAIETPATIINTEYRILVRDGSYHWVEARGRSHLDDPHLDGIVINVRDISERKQREQQLAETAARLTQKNEQLERLAKVVSHDLQTPLSTAEKLTQLLRADLAQAESDPEIEQSLQDLEATHERLRAFADNLPRLARESTDVEGPTDCELAGVAEAAWSMVDTEGLTLDIESTCRLQADPDRLQRIFENLFQNTVIHATPPATTVRVGTFEDGFYIEDDGPGIQPEQRTELFEYGMSTGSGSGFGLAIVRTTVEAHGWSITVVDSSTEMGARFEIETAS